MNRDKAIEILEIHNKWRRDNDGIYEMSNPKELGEAIDTAVSDFKNVHLQSGAIRSLRRFIIKLLPLFIVEIVAPYICKGRLDNIGNQTYYRLYDAKKCKGAGLLMRRS